MPLDVIHLTVPAPVVAGLCAAAFTASYVRVTHKRGSTLVRTRSGQQNFKRQLEGEPCKYCTAVGRVKCMNCGGVGRTNHRGLVVLPKGEGPDWCMFCRGSGLATCTRCFGRGVRPPRIGFRLPNE